METTDTSIYLNIIEDLSSREFPATFELHLMPNLKFGLLGHDIAKQNVCTFNFEMHHAVMITYFQNYIIVVYTFH